MTELRFTSEMQEGRIVLSVAGEIDMQTAVTLKAHVESLEAGGRVLVLDLGQVPFVDSSGLGALVGLKKQQERLHGRLLLGPVSPHVQRVLEITKMDQVFQRAEV